MEKIKKLLTKGDGVRIFMLLVATTLSILIIGQMQNKASAEQAKADPCKQYQELAMEYLPTPPKDGRFEWHMDILNARASVSAAYSSYYLVCREMERSRK